MHRAALARHFTQPGHPLSGNDAYTRSAPLGPFFRSDVAIHLADPCILLSADGNARRTYPCIYYEARMLNWH